MLYLGVNTINMVHMQTDALLRALYDIFGCISAYSTLYHMELYINQVMISVQLPNTKKVRSTIMKCYLVSEINCKKLLSAV